MSSCGLVFHFSITHTHLSPHQRLYQPSPLLNPLPVWTRYPPPYQFSTLASPTLHRPPSSDPPSLTPLILRNPRSDSTAGLRRTWSPTKYYPTHRQISPLCLQPGFPCRWPRCGNCSTGPPAWSRSSSRGWSSSFPQYPAAFLQLSRSKTRGQRSRGELGRTFHREVPTEPQGLPEECRSPESKDKNYIFWVR